MEIQKNVTVYKTITIVGLQYDRTVVSFISRPLLSGYGTNKLMSVPIWVKNTIFMTVILQVGNIMWRIMINVGCKRTRDFTGQQRYTVMCHRVLAQGSHVSDQFSRSLLSGLTYGVRSRRLFCSFGHCSPSRRIKCIWTESYRLSRTGRIVIECMITAVWDLIWILNVSGLVQY